MLLGHNLTEFYLDRLNLSLSIHLVFLDFFSPGRELLDLLFSFQLNGVCLILVLIVLRVVVLDDLAADCLLDLKLLPEIVDLVSERLLLHLLLPFCAGDGAIDDPSHVLDLELGLRLRLGY